ncbi:alpha/beta hydrolase [Lutibacter flavus]|uniref:Acetyl esterase/lipase n=1 Tax=Lutibacter flavus TaxID=691689 RepID=A0A238VBA9_9FLAO|nr:alpha/beta hydrolase [Lutibacter flavus]SNR31675.1 Acetyl esterase/lipase [Lutibacter flavus]
MKYTLNLINKFTILLIIVICTYSCINSNYIDVPKITASKEIINVSYGATSLQKYDIYLPENRSVTTTKVIMLIHGGSWISGDKNDLNYLVTYLKNKNPNYAIVNINYQLATLEKSPFPMQINDIQLVIKHLKSKSTEYEITTRIGIIGISAGGHLGMLYAYGFDELNNVEMVCSIIGPTNFLDQNYYDNPDFTDIISGIQLITGVNYIDNPEYYSILSPYYVASESSPPTILFYGGMDPLVPISQGIDLHNKLDELGIINEFTLYENEGHGWEGPALTDTYNKLENFIVKHF